MSRYRFIEAESSRYSVTQLSRGFRNRAHFKTAIYFHCGKLDLYPHETRKSHLSELVLPTC
jgi:hypothetical protein